MIPLYIDWKIVHLPLATFALPMEKVIQQIFRWFGLNVKRINRNSYPDLEPEFFTLRD